MAPDPDQSAAYADLERILAFHHLHAVFGDLAGFRRHGISESTYYRRLRLFRQFTVGLNPTEISSDHLAKLVRGRVGRMYLDAADGRQPTSPQ